MCWHIRDPVHHKTVQILLQNGADPNEVFRGVSCWQNALSTTKCFLGETLNSFQELEKILRLMLEAGANPHVGLEWIPSVDTAGLKWGCGRHFQNAAQIIENTFILGKPNRPSRDWESSDDEVRFLVKDDRLEIAKLGEGLLDLLREKQKTTPQKAIPPKLARSNTGNSTNTGILGWRKAVSRRTKNLRVQFRARFSGTWKK